MKKKLSQSTKKDQYTVVLEDLRSNFKVFGESLESLRENNDRKFNELGKNIGTLKTDVGTLKIDVGTLKIDVGTLKKDVGELKTDVKTLKTDMVTVKSELSIIRNNQVTRDEFKLLETRVLQLEKQAR